MMERDTVRAIVEPALRMRGYGGTDRDALLSDRIVNEAVRIMKKTALAPWFENSPVNLLVALVNELAPDRRGVQHDRP